MIQTPVLVNVFNRPAETERLLKCLQTVKPAKVYFSADAPRENCPEDEKLCAQVKEIVDTHINWNALVEKNYAKKNLGLRKRMSSAISWSLELSDRVIILEDDCIPDPTFFKFCEELLEYHKENPRVGAITGNNFQSDDFSCDYSYYFSRYPHCWGWATWRRAWAFYDDEMSQWPDVACTVWLKKMFPNKFEALYWNQIFNDTFHCKINSWAYRWLFSFWMKEMLCATPKRNLVMNIGVGNFATNTKKAITSAHFKCTRFMDFPIQHPIILERNSMADDYVQRSHFGEARDKTLRGRVMRLFLKFMRNFQMKNWQKNVFPFIFLHAIVYFL